MSCQSQYLKKLHKSTLQDVIDDLVKEKEEGWKNGTSRDSYTTKLKCLELMGISITRNNGFSPFFLRHFSVLIYSSK